ncbi:MAG: hypothetical protein JWN03_1605 [Nocardia sp.]|nr:hypothetical protein [Nocardia sp.]
MPMEAQLSTLVATWVRSNSGPTPRLRGVGLFVDALPGTVAGFIGRSIGAAGAIGVGRAVVLCGHG